MKKSKIRRPNFLHRANSERPLSPSHQEGDESARSSSASLPLLRPPSSLPSFSSSPPAGAHLASYTRRCRGRLLSAAARDCFFADEAPALPEIGKGNEGGRIDRDEQRENDDEPSMEQCIALLGPSLEAFRIGCVKADKARAKRDKKRQRQRCEEECGEDGEEDDEEDEVPPKLLSLARFFHFRWLPIKRALLRPIPHDESRDVEVGVRFRLRLARACWKRGLLAAAEYESLRRSLDISVFRTDTNPFEDSVGGKRQSKRPRANGSGNLEERVRLSLERLPTDVLRPERSQAAWRHAREMLIKCRDIWDKGKGAEQTELGKDSSGESSAPHASNVADWAMTSWTALLLSRGMDHPDAVRGDRLTRADGAHVEGRLAMLLTDRSPSGNPASALSRAVASRIDDLLTPYALPSLTGLHLYSLGRLLALFRSRKGAEAHIVRSLVKCSCTSGNMVGLEPLSRLLAVYCCSVSAAPEDSGTRRTAGRDMESRLRAMLDDDGIVHSSVGDQVEMKGLGKRPADREMLSFNAKSLLEAVLSAVAHLIRCSKHGRPMSP